MPRSSFTYLVYGVPLPLNTTIKNVSKFRYPWLSSPQISIYENNADVTILGFCFEFTDDVLNLSETLSKLKGYNLSNWRDEIARCLIDNGVNEEYIKSNVNTMSIDPNKMDEIYIIHNNP